MLREKCRHVTFVIEAVRVSRRDNIDMLLYYLSYLTSFTSHVFVVNTVGVAVIVELKYISAISLQTISKRLYRVEFKEQLCSVINLTCEHLYRTRNVY